MSWVLQPCSIASVYQVDHSASQYYPMLYGFPLIVVVFVNLVPLAQGACVVSNYAKIEVQYCCYCLGEINSEFKNISVQLCKCMVFKGSIA